MIMKREQEPPTGAYVELVLKGQFRVLYDTDDQHLITPYKWTIKKSAHCYYAVKRRYKTSDANFAKMHRHIMQTPPNLECHHINYNSLDNRRANLVNLTPSEHREVHRAKRSSVFTSGGLSPRTSRNLPPPNIQNGEEKTFTLHTTAPEFFPPERAVGAAEAVYLWWKTGRAGLTVSKIVDDDGNNYKVDGKKLVRI